MKIIKFQKSLNVVKGGSPFNLFTVIFRDAQNNEYSWAPRWDDLQNIFLSAFTTEYYNNEGRSEQKDLPGFINAAQRIVDGRY